MRIVCGAIVAACLFGAQAHAAKFKVLGKVTEPGQRDVSRVWRQISAGADDAGRKAVKILSKKPTEAWSKTVKQVLWGNYVEGIEATQVKPTKANVKSAVNALFDSNGALSQMGAAKRAKLADVVYAAAKKGSALFTGGIWGAFDMDYTHITLLNRSQNRLFSIFAGYSE